jgi:hypothetical protein
MSATLNSTGVLYGDSTQQNTAYIGVRSQIFTSSGTFTIPTGVTAVKVTVVGGGGNGGSASSSGAPYVGAGGGGGGGGVAIKYITGLTPGGTVSVTVGAVAGTSSFGAYCSATGGASGGAGGVSGGSGGSGGAGSSGDFNITAGSGTYGNVYHSIQAYMPGVGAGSTSQPPVDTITTYDASSNPTYYNGTPTGGQYGGRSGWPMGYGVGTTPYNATGYGNGGGGAGRAATAGTTTGGTGTAGIVVVEW